MVEFSNITGQLGWLSKLVIFIALLVATYKIYKKLICLLDLWVAKNKKHIQLEIALLDKIISDKGIKIEEEHLNLSKKIKKEIDKDIDKEAD